MQSLLTVSIVKHPLSFIVCVYLIDVYPTYFAIVSRFPRNLRQSFIPCKNDSTYFEITFSTQPLGVHLYSYFPYITCSSVYQKLTRPNPFPITVAARYWWELSTVKVQQQAVHVGTRTIIHQRLIWHCTLLFDELLPSCSKLAKILRVRRRTKWLEEHKLRRR